MLTQASDICLPNLNFLSNADSGKRKKIELSVFVVSCHFWMPHLDYGQIYQFLSGNCFFTVMHSYQDLLSRHVLGHAIRMFLLRRWYHPSALCTATFPLLFQLSSKSLLNVCSIWGSGKFKECLLFKYKYN